MLPCGFPPALYLAFPLPLFVEKLGAKFGGICQRQALIATYGNIRQLQMFKYTYIFASITRFSTCGLSL